MYADKLKKGETVVIKKINDDNMRAYAMRLGLDQGVTITCHEIIPAGPIIVRKGNQEIAVGRNFAKKIEIEDIDSCACNEVRR